MSKFRKKPVVIDATQYYGTREHAEYLILVYAGKLFIQDWPDSLWSLFAKTLEGDMKISAADWIITGVNGEVYPCKPDIFAKTYEAVA